MADQAMRVSQQQTKPIKIGKWKVRQGNTVSMGRIILIYDFTDAEKPEQKKLKASQAGIIHKILAEEGKVVQPGEPLYEIKACSHPTIMNDMCAECGADLMKDDIPPKTTASVPMIHAIPELKVSEEQAQQLGQADNDRLLKDRKLVLLVDLDQTLIHTTNDNIPPNIKDVYHFQLYGAKSPWYHTRLRPGTHRFLNSICEFYELHICTFGARNYAHMIAMFLDPEQKFFSNRILSRDECFDPTSKKANLRALFPCGDDMVCIIDDREDVWSHALNLIHVKPYHFFQHTGDINAPPGLEKLEADDKEGMDLTKIVNDQLSKEKDANTEDVNQKTKKSSEPEEIPKPSEPEEIPKLSEPEEIPKSSEPEENSEEKGDSEQKDDVETVKDTENKATEMESNEINNKVEDRMPEENTNNKEVKESEATKAETIEAIDKVEEKDAENKENEQESKELEEEENKMKLAESHPDENTVAVDSESIEPTTAAQETKQVESSTEAPAKEELKEDQEGQSEGKLDIPPDTMATSGNDNNGKLKAVPNPSKNEKQAHPDDNLIEIEDPDDYIVYLEDVLRKIHRSYFELYDKMQSGKIPDLKHVIPYVKSRVLQGCKLVFSGLVPTHYKLEQSKAYQVARSLGAHVQADLDDETTHLVAVRPGTAKVNAGRRKKHLKIVTSDWLWCCSERWEHADERIFPLNAKGSKNRHPPPHCSSPEHVTSYPEHDTPALRKRTPSGRFMDTINPLMSFSSDDIADMDKEVEDILDDESDDSEPEASDTPQAETEKEEHEEEDENDDNNDTDVEEVNFKHMVQTMILDTYDAQKDDGVREATKRSDNEEDDQEADDKDSSSPKRKRDLDEDGENSQEEEEEDELPSRKFRRGGEMYELDDENDPDDNDTDSYGAPDEEDDGEWNMMGAALEREFLQQE